MATESTSIWESLTALLANWASKALGGLWSLVFSYVIVPLVSKAYVAIVAYFQEKKDIATRDKAVDDAIANYKAAPTPEAQENAFKDLIRARGTPAA